MKSLLRFLTELFPVCFGVITLSFFLIHLIPGDPVEIMLGDSARVSDQDQLRKSLGLDRPVLEQYLIYLKNLSQLDLGTSLIHQKPVLKEIMNRFPASLELAFATLILSSFIGIPLGVVSSQKPNGLRDHGIQFLSLLGLALPAFCIAPLLIWVFSLQLNWLPVSERGSVWHLLLPSMTMASGISALLIRLTRAAMLEVLHKDYIRTARAKGVSDFSIFFRHALKNAFLPILTTLGLIFASLVTGSVIVETLFDWPGLGQLLIHSIHNRDYPSVQGTVLVISLLYVLTNSLTDRLYQYLQPQMESKL